MSQFGERLKKLRADLDLTLEDVARKIGTHKSYISGIENPRATLALVRRVAPLLDATIDTNDLEEAGKQFDTNLKEIVAQNNKIANYVKKLEARDAPEESPPARPSGKSDLPPASELVAEIEQFLRQQRSE